MPPNSILGGLGMTKLHKPLLSITSLPYPSKQEVSLSLKVKTITLSVCSHNIKAAVLGIIKNEVQWNLLKLFLNK